MNAVPSAFAELVDDTLSDPEAALGERWRALTVAAAVVAHLAGRAPGEAVPAAELAARLRSTDSARHACVARGIQDLVAVMRTGISALLAITASKSDPKPAATALWSEYRAAQDAVLSLLGPPQFSHGAAYPS